MGGKTAALLGEYGLHTVADVADVPQHTLQRLTGARVCRALHEHAHGRDTTVVDPTPAPASLSSEHRFPQDELDPAAHRCALLTLADDLGTRLRATDQIATGVTLTIRYADGSATRCSRTLHEATQHTNGPQSVHGVRPGREAHRRSDPGAGDGDAGQAGSTETGAQLSAHRPRCGMY